MRRTVRKRREIEAGNLPNDYDGGRPEAPFDTGRFFLGKPARLAWATRAEREVRVAPEPFEPGIPFTRRAAWEAAMRPVAASAPTDDFVETGVGFG